MFVWNIYRVLVHLKGNLAWKISFHMNMYMMTKFISKKFILIFL